MKKAFAVILILMAILTVIYVSAVASKNGKNYDSDAKKRFFADYDNIAAAYEYQSETPPTTWFTPEELGIHDVLELGEENDSWLNIAVFDLNIRSAIFLYNDKFYQVSRHCWTGRYVCYAAFPYRGDAPSVWYMPAELGIIDIVQYGKLSGGFHIAVDLAKEPFALQSENPIFLYKDKFYQVSSRWVTFSGPTEIQWQIPIGATLGAGWALTGALFLKWRKKE